MSKVATLYDANVVVTVANVVVTVANVVVADYFVVVRILSVDSSKL